MIADERFNHWTASLAFITMLSIGLILDYVELAKPNRMWLLNLHKATGVLLFVWAIWRVGYRL